MSNKIPYSDKKELMDEKAIKSSVNEAVKKASEPKVIQIPSKKKEESEKEKPLVAKLSNTYSFEGTNYNEIDLNGMHDMSTLDLQQVEKMYYGEGNIAPINEMSIGYCMAVAARATKLPIELFDRLKMNDAVKVKNIVSHFLLS